MPDPDAHRTDDQPTTVVAEAGALAALDQVTRPIGRDVITLAALALADALVEVTGAERIRLRAPGSVDGVELFAQSRSTPVLSRLLALDLAVQDTVVVVPRRDDGTTGAGWTIARDHAEETLSVRPTDVDPLPHVGASPVVTALVRGHLRHLVEGAGTSAWMEPFPSTVAERHRDRRRQEDEAAIRLLADWLDIEDMPVDGIDPATWWTRLGFEHAPRPLLRTWVQWLREQEVLAADGTLLHRGRAALPTATDEAPCDPPVRRLLEVFGRHRESIIHVLRGDMVGMDLLEMTELRPGRVMAEEVGLEPLRAQILEEMARRSRGNDRPLVLADVGGFLEDDPVLRQGIDDLAFERWTAPAGRPEPGARAADVVLAVGSLHRWRDASEAARAMRDLLRPDGIMVAVEPVHVGGLSLLLASLIEGGFSAPSGAPATSPMIDPDAWTQLLGRAGICTSVVALDTVPAVVITGIVGEPGQSHGTDVPAAGLMPGSGPEETPEPIRPGTETEVARLWADLIPTPPRTRQDTFFALGGDSLRATRLLAAVRQRFGVELTMRDLFADPRLGVIAARIDAARETTDAGTEDLEEGLL
jgi:SAM-dependent methyltransferase/acyl carrier protein